MRFQCSNCLSIVAIDDSESGQAVACGNCSQVIVVPMARTAPGAVISDFVIEKELGKGGLATVYLAHQISLDRSVALKILHQQYADDAEFIIDFIREARAAAQLNHPNIVQAHAVGEENGIHFFAMEYVQGTTLKNVLAHSGRLVVDRALMICREIATALDFAWKNKQLVHRDIKPDNIIVLEGGKVKLADLGLARVGTDILRGGGETEILGTPQYIAPELLLGEAADHRTDIYSLGATLYHALTGQYPFVGNSAAEIARKHIIEELVPPHQVVPEIPESVSMLVEGMMAKRPGHRYQSAAELLDDLDRVQRNLAPRYPLDPASQHPIDLACVSEELAAQGAPGTVGQAEGAGGDTARKTTLKAGSGGTQLKFTKNRLRPSGIRKSSSGKTQLRMRGAKGTADQAAILPLPGAEGAEVADDQAGGIADAGAEDQADAAATGSARARGRARAQKKSSGRILVFILVMGLILAGAGIFGARELAKRNRAKAKLNALLGLGLTEAQIPGYRELAQAVSRELDAETILTTSRDLIAEFPDSDPLRREVMKLAGPYLETEVRELRREKHQTELTAWRLRSRELEEAKRQAAMDQQLQEQQERERLAREEAARRQEADRKKLTEQLQEEQITLRQEAIDLCRAHRFGEAKVLFGAMAAAHEKPFPQWATCKQESIDMAAKAFALVHGSGDALKGVKMAIAGQVRPAYITRIGADNVYSEIREKVYDHGKLLTEKVQRFTTPINELDTSALVRLMETGWRLNKGDPAELNLLIGAYLLCRAEELDLASRRLKASGKDDQVEPMLQELDELRRHQ